MELGYEWGTGEMEEKEYVCAVWNRRGGLVTGDIWKP